MIYEVLELCCFEWFQNLVKLLDNGIFVLELCCFEWFQNDEIMRKALINGFRAVLFRMVPKLGFPWQYLYVRFRAVLFRMVPKLS